MISLAWYNLLALVLAVLAGGYGIGNLCRSKWPTRRPAWYERPIGNGMHLVSSSPPAPRLLEREDGFPFVVDELATCSPRRRAWVDLEEWALPLSVEVDHGVFLRCLCFVVRVWKG